MRHDASFTLHAVRIQQFAMERTCNTRMPKSGRNRSHGRFCKVVHVYGVSKIIDDGWHFYGNTTEF